MVRVRGTLVKRRREKEALEARVVKRALDEFGVPAVKLKPGGQTGWPDQLFFVIGGKPLLIEFKWPGYEPEPRQAYIHEMLRGLGYEVQCHTDEDEACAAIERAKALGAAQLSKAGGQVAGKPRKRGPIS